MPVSIESGSSISHYRVLSPLGSGGMGEVYLAHDTTLDRQIALKILPPELVSNEDRLRRFVQEAKSASSLSHPHIVTIHEIGTAPVQTASPATSDDDSGPIHYIAMELIDGETLKTKIHTERVGLKKLLGYLTQAAEGLAKAHAAGIVHRDLKPDNIMVTRDGYAKVLDFGLAKLTAPGVAPAGNEATAVKDDKTREGVVMGTIGYMSPEQVQGRPADHRADIFSFGCILYEAAARKRPFEAESNVDVMHKILHDKPEPLDLVAPETPAELRRIIRRCLAKEPEKRYQSIKDLALELGELVEEYDELSRSGSTPSGSAISGPALAISGKRRPAMIAGIAIATALLLGGVTWVAWKAIAARKGEATAPAAFANMTMKKITSSGHAGLAAISPDGRYIAYALRDRGLESLWVRQVATGVDMKVVEPAAMGYRGITFSPDGNYLYYVRLESETSNYSSLYRIASLGGPPRNLLFDIDTPVTFSPDGTRMAFMRGYPHLKESGVVVASADGTGEKKLAVRKAPQDYPLLQTSWSPDGKTIAVIAFGQEGGAHSSLVVVDANSGKEQAVGTGRWAGISGVAWLPDGNSLVVTGTEKADSPTTQMYLVAYPSGEMRRVTNDLNNYDSISTTRDGTTIATIVWTFSGQIFGLPAADPGAAKARTSGGQESVADLVPMPDGTLLFTATGNGTNDIWALDAAGNRTQLTFGPGRSVNPAVSADGKTIAYTSFRDGKAHLWKMDPRGGSQVQITNGEGEHECSLSPDGTWIVYHGPDETLWRQELSGGAPRKLGELLTSAGAISPDGTKIAMAQLESRPDRVHRMLRVIPSQGGAPIASFEVESRGDPVWSPAGDAIDYALDAQGVTNLWRQPLDGLPPKQLTKFEQGTIDSFAWMPDGTLAIARNEAVSDVVLISSFR